MVSVPPVLTTSSSDISAAKQGPDQSLVPPVLPPQVLLVLREIRAAVAVLWPGYEDRAVRTWLFLRCICPALVSAADGPVPTTLPFDAADPPSQPTSVPAALGGLMVLSKLLLGVALGGSVDAAPTNCERVLVILSLKFPKQKNLQP
jgi:hypothetical protein